GSLGDLGTLLPIAVAMILVNGLDPVGIFVSVGLYYILSGAYYGVTVPVQPMKVIGAYAIAAGLSTSEIASSALLMGVILLLVGATGAIRLVSKYTPNSVIRGVQLSTGILLVAEGIRFMLGSSRFQELQEAAEPFLRIQNLGPVPLGLLIGGLAFFLTLLLLENKRFPAGLLVVMLGFALGALLGTYQGLGQLSPGLHLPQILPFGLPGGADLSFAFLALVLPQLPMTLGNAVLAYTDLSQEYFPEKAQKVTNKSACISMGLANLGSFCLGGMPLCHGAGGLAAHYRFGARTAGSNLMIGGIFLLAALVLGQHILPILNLLPMAVLGVLLVFAGAQLGLTILDLKERKEMFTALLILGITLAFNLAGGFLVGIAVAYILRWEKLSI
ncbi:MAG: putative sulfate/molybdate transporter, partial [Desulfohalobiaceae bacterium]